MKFAALLSVLLAWATTPAGPQTSAGDVPSVLSAMDKLSVGLNTLSFRFRAFAVVGQDAEESAKGVVRVAGMADGNFEANVEPEGSPQRFYYRGMNLITYDPAGRDRNEMSLKDYAELVPSLKLLMLGTSGKRVAAAWDITAKGSETIGSVATTKLELVPKSPAVRSAVEKVEIWFPAAGGGFPVRLQLNFSGLMRFEFSDVIVNPRFPAGSLRPR